MEIKDLAGLGKPLEKLIAVIARGTGNVSASYLVKKRTGAKVDEIEKVAAAIQKASGETGIAITYRDGAIEMVSSDAASVLVSDGTLETAASGRDAYQSRMRQQNVEAITSIAAEQLVGEDVVSDEEVEPDWVNRFFRYAEDVSSDEMRKVWARLLAGEVSRPGTFSLRALDFIRSLSAKEAQQLAELGKYVCSQGTTMFLPWDPDHPAGRLITTVQHYELAEIGVLYPQVLALQFFRNKDPHLISHGTTALQVFPPLSGAAFPVQALKFTGIGTEIMKLVDADNAELPLQRVATQCIAYGCEVRYATIDERRDDGGLLISPYRSDGPVKITV